MTKLPLILFLSLFVTCAQAATVQIKDSTADYQMTVNPDGSINTNFVSGSTVIIAPGGSIAVTPNTNGVMVNLTVSTGGVIFTAPANAIGFILQSDSTNTSNIRWAIGSTATASVGTLTEPGRSSDFIPCSGNISAAAISDSPTVSLQWILSH